MNKLLLLSAFFFINPVNAGVVHKIISSAQGTIDGAYSQVKSTPSVYSLSSSGVSIGTMPGLTAPAVSDGNLTGVAATMKAAENVTMTTAGAATTFTESYSQGSAVTTAPSLTHGGLTSLPTGNDVVSYAGGSNQDMSIQITSVSGGVLTLSPGGPGSSVTGSITTSLEIGN
tara:strand:- start:368 stop:883 length:516 start_codon:yes stop_codon:yes gene_type:complete